MYCCVEAPPLENMILHLTLYNDNHSKGTNDNDALCSLHSDISSISTMKYQSSSDNTKRSGDYKLSHKECQKKSILSNNYYYILCGMRIIKLNLYIKKKNLITILFIQSINKSY